MTKKLKMARHIIVKGMFTAFMFVGIANVNAQLSDGLIGYWPLDEGDGTTAANAAGGSDAELHNGVEWVDDPDRGTVLSFDGVDGYADAGAETIHQMAQDNDFTWSVWINQGSGNGPNNVVLGNRYSPEGGDFAPREFIKYTPTKFEFHLDGGGQNCEYDDLANNEGVWVHYVVVKAGNAFTHYSNGEVGESSTFTSELLNPQPFYFGGDKTDENWNGMLDEIAIWDRPITEEEVALIYNDGEGTALVSQSSEDSIPYVSKLTAGPGGFGFRVADEPAIEVDVDSIVVSVDGSDVAVAKSKEDGVTTVKYTAAQLFAPNTEHIMTFSYVDTDGMARKLEKGFKVKEYTMVDAGAKVDSSLQGDSGFIANITQISTGQSGKQSMHGNNVAKAEKQLNGEYIDKDYEEPYLNEADWTDDPEPTGWSYYPVIVEYVNQDQNAFEGGVEHGNFTSNNGYPDEEIPGIPGWYGETDGIVGEFAALLDLARGSYTFGVNSDDGFKATIGANFNDILAQEIGGFDGGRAAGNTQFTFYIAEAGLYPYRVLWYEGGGGASVELFSLVDIDGKATKVLINDPDVEGSIKAYTPKGATVDESITERDATTGRAAVVSIMPAPGKKRVEPTSSIEVVIENGSATAVDQSSVKMSLNGEEVAADVSKSGDIVTISYTGGLAAEVNTAIVSFKESNGVERSAEWSFEVKVTKPGEAAGTLANGLIGYWPLDEGDGTTAANAAGGADAELHNGVEWVDDPDRGMVLSFDGVDGYADAGAETIPQMTQNNDFTWSVWINQGSGNGPNNVVLGNRYSPEGGDFAPREFIKYTPTKFEFHRDAGAQNCEYDDLVNSEGEWVHYVVVKTGNTLTHYSNGEEGESSTFTSELQNPQPFYFGGDKTAENWNGMLDDIAIWDRPITEEEVALIYNDGEGTVLLSAVDAPVIAYQAPGGGWAYSLDAGDISSWSHDNGSDQWDDSAIGGEFGDDNRPGGVSLLDGYIRLQDTGDPRDYGHSDPGSNRKIYLGQSISDKGGSDTILDDGATIHFIARIPTHGPLDLLHPGGGGGEEDYPAGGDGYENHDGGKGNIGVKQGAGGNISFSLNEAGKVLITEDGTELELSTTEWHEFWVTIEKSDGGHTVSVYLDGSTEANVFTVTAGGGSDFDGSYVAMGVGATPKSGALDVAAFDFSPGVIAPGGGGPAPEPPTISIVNNGDGTVTVTFEGTLQAAATVNGPWVDVDEASPLKIPADQAQQFGRAKN